MENPFSYRNRLAQYFRKQRKRIDVLDDNLKIKESRNLLYQELEKKRVDISYKKAKEKQQMTLDADFRIFEEQLVNGAWNVSSLNGKKAKELILYYSKKKVGRKLPSLGLLNLRYLTPEAAQILASYDSGISIPWSALKNNPKTLKNLLYCEHGIIFLKVGSLDEEMVKICQEAKSCFSLHEVTAISPVAAQSLMRCKNLALISIKDDPGLTPILEMLAPLKSKILLFPRKY